MGFGAEKGERAFSIAEEGNRVLFVMLACGGEGWQDATMGETRGRLFYWKCVAEVDSRRTLGIDYYYNPFARSRRLLPGGAVMRGGGRKKRGINFARRDPLG